MKREFLTGLGIAEDLIDKIMGENGKDVEATKNKFADYEDLKTQISEANKQIESFKEMDIEGVKKSADEYKTKYETAQADFQKQIAERDYSTAINEHLSGIEFTSNSAKEAFISKVKTSGLKNDNGKLLGFDDYLNKYKAEDAGAFKDATPPPAIFAGKTGGGSPAIADAFVSSMRKAAGLNDDKQ